MMQSDRDYGTRMLRAKTPDELRREELRRAELLRWLALKPTDETRFRSINQDKPKLHLK